MKLYWLLFPLALLTGCATTSQTQSTAQSSQATPVANATPQVEKIHRWYSRGAIGIKDGQQGFSAAFNWQQTGPNYYSLQLLGPGGSGSMKITGKPKLVTLQLANGERASAPNAEILLEQQTGWFIPVSNLYYWSRGIPVPGLPANKKFNQEGTLSQLHQAGWHITYLDYRPQNGMLLPSKMQLAYKNLKIKIVIKQWALG